MAYALLGNVPPVIGIYMAIFPALVYAFLGTSKHVAMGKHSFNHISNILKIITTFFLCYYFVTTDWPISVSSFMSYNVSYELVSY